MHDLARPGPTAPMSQPVSPRLRELRESVVHGLALLAFLLVGGLLMARRTIDLESTQAFTEAPLVLYLFVLLRAPLREGRLRSLAAALPIVWFYTLHDLFFIELHRVPDFADFVLLADLYVTLGPFLKLLLCVVVALPWVLWLGSLDVRRLVRPPFWLLATPGLLVVSCLLVAPARAYRALDSVTFDEEWSDGLTTDHWGRLYAACFREVRRQGFARELTGFTPLAESTLRLAPELLGSIGKRNVHLIVLESFIDVRLLRKVRFSEPPLADSFTRWVDPFISTSISPVFGGETARAEFELLCGVPSLRLYGLEFLTFSGAPTYCLPQILEEAGYHTVLTFPLGPVFFNARRAYPGLGFRERIFGDDHGELGQETVKQHGENYLNDAELFPQNLDKVKRLVQAGRPFLNYVLTIYGHWDFEVDRHGNPPALETSVHDEELRKISVMMHQRTEALETYLKGLREIDPHAIVVLVADHLPSLTGGSLDYARYDYRERDPLPPTAAGSSLYENFLLVFIDGQPRKLPRMRHFDLPHYILDQLSQGAYCKVKRCDFGALPVDSQRYLDEYRTVLGLASRRLPIE